MHMDAMTILIKAFHFSVVDKFSPQSYASLCQAASVFVDVAGRVARGKVATDKITDQSWLDFFHPLRAQ